MAALQQVAAIQAAIRRDEQQHGQVIYIFLCRRKPKILGYSAKKHFRQATFGKKTFFLNHKKSNFPKTISSTFSVLRPFSYLRPFLHFDPNFPSTSTLLRLFCHNFTSTFLAKLYFDLFNSTKTVLRSVLLDQYYS